MKVFIMVNVIKLKSKRSKLLLTGLTLAIGLSCMPSQASQDGWMSTIGKVFSCCIRSREDRQGQPAQTPLSSSLAGTTTTASTTITSTTGIAPQQQQQETKLLDAKIRAEARAKLSEKERKDLNIQLICACWINDLGAVIHTLNAGADVDCSCVAFGAFVKAAYKGHIVIVRVLISAGANVNCVSESGETVLMIASDKPHAGERHTEIVQALIDAGANVNCVSESGDTALEVAAHWGNILMVEALIRAGADINLQDNGGNTALMEARNCNHPEIVTLLETYTRAQQGSLQDAIVLHRQHRISDPVLNLACQAEQTSPLLGTYFPEVLVGLTQQYLIGKDRDEALRIAAQEKRIWHPRSNFYQLSQSDQKHAAAHRAAPSSLTTTTTPTTSATTIMASASDSPTTSTPIMTASGSTMAPMSSLMTTIPSTSVSTLSVAGTAQSAATK
jgi:hypothetical protein